MAISVRSVSKEYGRKVVLRDVSFEVPPGGIYGLLGANGSGKTTLLRMIAGALPPTSGRIAVAGETGYVAQKFGLYDDLTVEENLAFVAECRGLSGRVSEVLSRFELTSQRTMRTGLLSYGWKQRLSLAAALCHDPAVLILDEATSGVDAVARLRLWEYLYQLVRPGLAIVLATHDMDEAARCHRLGFLQHGRLIAAESPAALRASFDDVPLGQALLRLAAQHAE